MSLSGLTCNPCTMSCCLLPRRSNSVCGFYLAPPHDSSLMRKMARITPIKRNYWTGSTPKYILKRVAKTKGAIYAAFGDISDGSTEIFPRIHVKDPYKRLGISREASEEEIQAARNYLISRYAGHKPSIDAIESAHDKIIMQSFIERKSPKINFNKKIREVTQSRAVKAVTSRFATPATSIILKTSAVFIVLGILTVLFPTEEGPTLQVAISLVVSIYFIYERLRSRIRAFLYGMGAFFVSWLLGTFLMVSVIPPVLSGPRSLEVTTALISYILLWVSSTYLK